MSSRKIITRKLDSVELERQKNRKEKVPKKTLAFKKEVFIVHGTDHAPMKELKVMLEEVGLKPIVLHEQPSGGRTIVEKLEKYSDVGYAFVILTPDISVAIVEESKARCWEQECSCERVAFVLARM